MFGQVGQPEIEATTDLDGDVSLEVTQKVGPNLVSSLTVNEIAEGVVIPPGSYHWQRYRLDQLVVKFQYAFRY